jgi:hypothetical protein
MFYKDSLGEATKQQGDISYLLLNVLFDIIHPYYKYVKSPG